MDPSDGDGDCAVLKYLPKSIEPELMVKLGVKDSVDTVPELE